MLVKNVVLSALNMLQNNDLINALKVGDELTADQKEELDLMVMCVNLVNNIIATEYIKLKEKVSFHSTGNKLLYSDISNKNILDIVSITDEYGNKLKFQTEYDGIITKQGKLVITYVFIPDELTLEDEIDFKTHLTERVFAYGVLAEYFFIKGVFDDASVWDIRFKQALQTIRRSLKEIKVLKREWL